MIIERSREHVVNLGNYESVRVGARITLDRADIEELLQDGLKIEDVVTQADECLDALLAADLAEAEQNVPPDKETHLTTWKK